MAGPSAADVRSVFSLPSTPGPSQPKAAPATERARKPEGMSRELYSLIGQSAPSLVAQISKPRLKQKPNLGGGGRAKWEWRSFQNQARSDKLRLSHWVKAGTPHDAEYPFAKYNVQNTTYTYTQDEYTKFLVDKDWTKEETDYLFDLVRQYDQRFYVVADRYEYPGGPPRSMEDLKDRYFSVCRKLVRHRPWPGDEATKAQVLSSFAFDKEREVMRKKYLQSLESRTPEEIAEEEALFTELKRLEQNERRFKKERDELLRTLLGIESGLPDVQPEEESGTGATPTESISAVTTKKTKKKGAVEPDTPTSAGATAHNATVSLPPPVPKKQSAKSAAYDALHCIHRTEVPQLTTATATKAAHQPVYLRSYKLPAPKSANAHKIAQVLGELGVSSTRLVMPTKDNCQKLEALLEAATALVETKKQVDKIDQEIRLAQERLGQGSAEGDADADAEDDTMDVDEPVEEGGRAQSVLSARSVRSNRGRKQP